MNRRKLLKGLFVGTIAGSVPYSTALASDNALLNKRIVNIARSVIGKPGGSHYNSWMFGYNVLMAAGAKGPYYGPQRQYAWGRPITWHELGPGDFIQFESTTIFRTQPPRCVTYWGCNSRCTLIVLSRQNGRAPGSLITVAYMYRFNVVRSAKIDVWDRVCGNEIYLYRPQTR